MLDQRVVVRLGAQFVEKPRRALHVGKEEGDCALRQHPHGGMMRGMRAYVTGSTGFIGSHVARELREQGAEVRDEWIDLGDRTRLAQAIDGCDVVFHLAALYSYRASAAEHQRVNVEGTRTIVELCRELGVTRLVHTSTCGTCGPVPGRQATEDDDPPGWELTVPYKRTKLAAERLVLEAVADGLDAVVVNPTTPVGDGDRFPTPTGSMIEGVATGRYRAFVATGVNVVDVRDVARGHLLAWEHGRKGQRYLLGGTDLFLGDLFAAVAELAGHPRPRLCIPYAGARALARAGLANADEVLLARLPMYFSWTKAARELGYSPGPVWPALRRAVDDVVLRSTRVSSGAAGAPAIRTAGRAR
jgi:dihydroflavonol-4-reductase